MRLVTQAALAIAVAALSSAVAVTLPARRDLDEADLARVLAATAPARDFAKAEAFEAMAGGAATSRKRADTNAFSHPSANLPLDEVNRFLVGNGLFRKDWVTAPSSTQASDGLGPLFNARACQSCHIKDGRGHAPARPEDPAVSLLLRLSVPPTPTQAADIAASRLPAAPEPVYGHQLQDFAASGLPAEGRVEIAYDDVAVPLNGGETATLRRPRVSIADPGYGPLDPQTMISARIAPPMIGLGLIEAIHEADILSQADPDDHDGDGISGRPNFVRDAEDRLWLGRFGWKAMEPSVRQQTAHAFFADMGLSTPMARRHFGDCTPRQTACLAMPDGAQKRLGDSEVPGDLLELVTFYSRNLAVPARRDVEARPVLAGKSLFYGAGCTACHTPKYVTRRDADHPAQRFQLIWPYSDFLLHDMGDDLADNRPEVLASGREWRTPPLWGIGLARRVSNEAGFLHDGRARSILEAVLWHGGEAQQARDRVVAMTPEERADLVRFLESL
jgi:CxxC motif-containing protein (DUF1111 family)